jgi:hypothetical protein
MQRAKPLDQLRVREWIQRVAREARGGSGAEPRGHIELFKGKFTVQLWDSAVPGQHARSHRVGDARNAISAGMLHVGERAFEFARAQQRFQRAVARAVALDSVQDAQQFAFEPITGLRSTVFSVGKHALSLSKM